MSGLMGGYYAARKKATSTTPSGGRSKPTISDTDYTSELKSQRDQLKDAQQTLSAELGTGSPEEVRATQSRIASAKSAVKTLEQAAQRQREARLAEAGVQPIDSTEQPFTFTNPPELGMFTRTLTGATLQALRDAQANRKAMPSRGQIFEAGAKSPTEMSAAAKRVNARISEVEASAEDIAAARRRAQQMLKSLQRAPDEDAVSFAKRQDPTFVPGEDFPTTVITKAAMQSRKVMEEIAALEAKEKELMSQVKVLERAQVLTGSAPKAVTPSRVAAEAKQQRTAEPQKTEGTEDREVFTVRGRSYRLPPNMNEDQKRAYKDSILRDTQKQFLESISKSFRGDS